MKSFFIFCIKSYQVLHLPFYQGVCRFHPSCSNYAIEAIQTHGVIKGTGLAIWRILRCQPFARGGIDPVPQKVEKKK
jgi:putative membrane protein insertion efficiency factor